MATDRFLIGYGDGGLQTDVQPWLIADNAFANLENAYILQGRLQKRIGSTLMGGDQLNSRVRYLLGVINGAGALSGTVPGSVFSVGQMFSVGTDVFTVNATGNPATTLTTNVAAAMTYDTTTGAYAVSGETPGTDVFFYPATPIMGIVLYYVTATKDYLTIGFDTQLSYKFDDITNAWAAYQLGDNIWTGTDSDFFWSINYQGADPSLNYLWTTNFTTADGIRYFTGTTWVKPVLNYTIGSVVATTDGSGNASGTTAAGFIGQVFNVGITAFTVTASSGALTVSAGGTGTGTYNITTGAFTFTGALANTSIYYSGNNDIATSRLIIQFRNRLLLFNTVELVSGVNKSFINRVRYSAVGSPLAPNAFMQDMPGNGGAIDAPVQEEIVTAQFIKDRLIVYFEASTFELAYTGNQVQPFIWQKLNTELGAESTFSEIPFDKQVLGVGRTGIHACNGNNVDRIDEIIPQYVFSFFNSENGPKRVVGVRDFYNEIAYWTYPSQNRSSDFPYPDKMLVYNYINNTWATNDDSFTFFGYFFREVLTPGATWGGTSTPWQSLFNLWNAGSSPQNNVAIKTIIGGNQEGFMLVMNSEVSSNAASLQVTDATSLAAGTMTISSINHNLIMDEFVLFENMNGITFTNAIGTVVTSAMARVSSDTLGNGTPNSLTVSLAGVTPTGTYTGGGTMARVSNISILTKQYNFYNAQDRSVYVSKIDFLVDSTTNGKVTVDFFISSSSNSLLSGGTTNGSLLGSNELETSPYPLVPFEQLQARLWHPLYFYAEGECVQFKIFMSPTQMFEHRINEGGTIEYVALQDFKLNAMVIYAQPTSSRMQ